jgi:hypothetical protein
VIGILELAALVFAAAAWRRTRAVADLIERVSRLERQVAALRVGTAPPPPAAEEPEVAPPPRPVASAAPPPPPPPPAPRVAPSAPRIDWEQLFGVRAAAVLGGIALALAGVLFFKYSIEHGLFPPWLRVVVGTVVGVACIAGSELTLRRRYAGTANALAGAGLVVLYAAFWAACVLYQLIGVPVAFVLMIAVTATGCVLSWRHRSLVTALLGLVGGFATPLLLASGADRPIGLFGYILLLDVGVLYLARERRWPLLATIALAGTLFFQVVWMTIRMGADQVVLGLGILAVFAALFAVAPRGVPAEDREQWLMAQAAAVLAPFGFVVYFALSTTLHAPLHALALLLVLLAVFAGSVAETQRAPLVGVGAAAASVASVGCWLVVHEVDAALAWTASASAVAIALVFHVFVERDPARALNDGPTPAALVAALGMGAALLAGTSSASTGAPWPWLAGFAGLAALVVRHGGFPGRGALHVGAAAGVGLAIATLHAVLARRPGFPPPGLHLGVLVAAAVAFQVVALARATAEARRWAEHGAAAIATVLLVHVAGLADDRAVPAWSYLATALALGLLVALAATRLGAGAWLVVAVMATAVAHGVWSPEHTPGVGLALEAVAVVLFTAWPFLVAQSFRAEPLAWRAAALAGPAWFLPLKAIFTRVFGSGAIGLLPLGLAVVALAAALRAREVWSAREAIRTDALAWFSAVAMGFVTVAIPLQLDREWITLGWALEGLAVTALWTRLDHPGLKWFGLALLGAATVRLVANPAVLGYYPRPAFRIVNWLAYTYLVPAAALLGTSALLGPRELARARAWEREVVYRRGLALGALATGLAGLVVVFVCINLEIADWFATGASLRVSFERLPARDLTTSLAWAIYSLVLLALGVGRRSIGLRWVSLGLLLVTIAKVFLHDLGELRDLYRVASLLGLAVSLILVSLAYQRFVFREAAVEKT